MMADMAIPPASLTSGAVGCEVACFPPIMDGAEQAADFGACCDAEGGNVPAGEGKRWRRPVAGEGEQFAEPVPAHCSFRRQ